MNVFVTGGAGYIGSVCVEELLDAGHDVTVYDNLTEGHRSAVDPRAVFLHARLSDESNMEEALRDANAEVVIHLAANALVGESMTNPGKYFRNNVSNAQRILEAAHQSGVEKFIFSSSCAVYGIPDRLPMTEDSPLQPCNPYGESKRMFETMLAWYHRIHGMEFVALRYFNAAGASEQCGEHHRTETHLIPNVLKVALGQAEHCDILGTDYPTPDGTCIRDYIHVVDIAGAHMQAMEPGVHGIYNLGNGEGCSVREVIQACEQVSGRPIRAVSQPRRAGDPPRLIADATRARKDLGWHPKYASLTDIVASAWEWHSKNPNGYPD